MSCCEHISFNQNEGRAKINLDAVKSGKISWFFPVNCISFCFVLLFILFNWILLLFFTLLLLLGYIALHNDITLFSKIKTSFTMLLLATFFAIGWRNMYCVEIKLNQRAPDKILKNVCGVRRCNFGNKHFLIWWKIQP